MSFQPKSELHKRRQGRNLAVAACLVVFIVILVSLSLVKLTQGGAVEAFDHAPRNSAVAGSD